MPQASKVALYANEVYPAKLVHQMEILILMKLNWCLTSSSPLHFLGYFHSRGLLHEAVPAGTPGALPLPAAAASSSSPAAAVAASGGAGAASAASAALAHQHHYDGWQGDVMAYKPLVPELGRYMHKYTDFFVDLALQEYSFSQYAPSLLAAAIVLAARKSLVIRCVSCGGGCCCCPHSSLPRLPCRLAGQAPSILLTALAVSTLATRLVPHCPYLPAGRSGRPR